MIFEILLKCLFRLILELKIFGAQEQIGDWIRLINCWVLLKHQFENQLNRTFNKKMNAEWSIWLFIGFMLVTISVFVWKKCGEKRRSLYEIQTSLRKSGKEAPLLLPDYSQHGKVSYQSI